MYVMTCHYTSLMVQEVLLKNKNSEIIVFRCSWSEFFHPLGYYTGQVGLEPTNLHHVITQKKKNSMKIPPSSPLNSRKH